MRSYCGRLQKACNFHRFNHILLFVPDFVPVHCTKFNCEWCCIAFVSDLHLVPPFPSTCIQTPFVLCKMVNEKHLWSANAIYPHLWLYGWSSVPSVNLITMCLILVQKVWGEEDSISVDRRDTASWSSLNAALIKMDRLMMMMIPVWGSHLEVRDHYRYDSRAADPTLTSKPWSMTGAPIQLTSKEHSGDKFCTHKTYSAKNSEHHHKVWPLLFD